MEQKIIKGEHYDLREITMQSTTERDLWMRTHPPTVPAGYRRVVRWQTDMKLVVGVEKVPEGAAPEKKDDAPDPKLASALATLQGLTDADLATKAAELSIANPPKKRPALMEAIARKMAESK